MILDANNILNKMKHCKLCKQELFHDELIVCDEHLNKSDRLEYN